MTHIHITLVGGQLMPVYNGIKETNPDKVIFIYSKETAENLELIKNEFPKIEFIESEPLSANKLDKIQKRAKRLYEQFKNDKISINISGGSKPWAYYFSKGFDEHPNVTIFYIDQNNVFGNLQTAQMTPFISDPLVQFRLNNNPLKHYVNFTEYTKEDFEQIEKIEKIRKENYDIFSKLTNLDKKKEVELKKETGIFYLDSSSYLEWDKKQNYIKVINQNKEVILQSESIFDMLFNYSWFELKVAKIISEWNEAKEIYLNCLFPTKKTFNTNFLQPKNEIDIIVNAGTKLLFVECKTHISESTDIDKFRTAVKNYGGQSAKALFVVENKIGIKELEKMTESKIIPFSIKENEEFDYKQKLLDLLDEKIKSMNE